MKEIRKNLRTDQTTVSPSFGPDFKDIVIVIGSRVVLVVVVVHDTATRLLSRPVIVVVAVVQ
jgi:hypothetical protein